MSRKTALLILDPYRRPEQMAYLTERAQILHQVGDQLWVKITENQASRFIKQGIIVQFHEEADWIILPAIVFNPIEGSPEAPEHLMASEPTGEEQAYYIVQFIIPPNRTWIYEIRQLGGNYIQNIPSNAAIYSLTHNEAEAINQLSYVRWIGLFHPACALHFTLCGQTTPYNAFSLKELTVDANSLPATQEGNIQVRFFHNVDLEAARNAVEAAGVSIMGSIGYGFLVNADTTGVTNLIKVPGASTVESYYSPELQLDKSRKIVFANYVSLRENTHFSVDLDGAGEIVGVIDTSLDTKHPDISERIIDLEKLNYIETPSSGATDGAETETKGVSHGTHVTGIIAGNGIKSSGFVKGIAPSSHIIFHSMSNKFPNVVVKAHNAGVRVHNNSFGTFKKAIFVKVSADNEYKNQTNEIDMFCFIFPESLMVYAVGNEERHTGPSNGDGKLDMNMLPFEAVAKNILSIGAVENIKKNEGFKKTYSELKPGSFSHKYLWPVSDPITTKEFSLSDNADEVALFSCRGEVREKALNTHRIKPDLVAPGTNILSLCKSKMGDGDWHKPIIIEDEYYQLEIGTSMAAPHVAGAALLVRQFFRSCFGHNRQPIVLESISAPDSGPLPDFIDNPAISLHNNSSVLLWITPASPDEPKNIMAAILDHAMNLMGSPHQIKEDVGDHPAPQIVQYNEYTFLLHRDTTSAIYLARYKIIKNVLTPDAAFGTDGTLTVTNHSRFEGTCPLAFAITDSTVATIWADNNSNALLFQRFDANNGAKIDNDPLILGDLVQASPHPYITFNDIHFAVTWVNHSDDKYYLYLRLIVIDGTLVGPNPKTIIEQNEAIQTPHLTWDSRRNLLVVVWNDALNHPGGEISLLFLDPAGNVLGSKVTPFSTPKEKTVRNPKIDLHPEYGYVLSWEDSAFNNTYDVALTFLDETGQTDNRIPEFPHDPERRNMLRISDSVKKTSGFANSIADQGIFMLWQSFKEKTSDHCIIYAQKISLQGKFPLITNSDTSINKNGVYVHLELLQHTNTDLRSISIVWAGGEYFLLRSEPGDVQAKFKLIKTNADGQIDTNYGTNGARELSTNIHNGQCELFWSESHIICAIIDEYKIPEIFLFKRDGDPLSPFQLKNFTDTANSSLQLGYISGSKPGIILVYGTGQPDITAIKYVVFKIDGNIKTVPKELATSPNGSFSIGTARRGWYHYVNIENHSIMVWHLNQDNANASIFLNIFNVEGEKKYPQNDIPLTQLPGDSKNVVIAPRITGISFPYFCYSREYAVAWQYRQSNLEPWQIRFSRINNDGTVKENPQSPAPPCHDVYVISQDTEDWFNNTNAIEPQLICTNTHDPWRDTSLSDDTFKVWHSWSPSYGLAWIGQPMTGENRNRTLYFTLIDENGSRVKIPRLAPKLPSLAPIVQVSKSGADVQDFQLIWNGRTFRLTWTEIEDGKIRHLQTALTRYGNKNVYHQPSSALIRATLINGATNINKTPLPNINYMKNEEVFCQLDGYGWGRLNLRQSIIPSPPVTMHIRDDNSIASGQTIDYRFKLPKRTKLLRVTLCWTDPPGARIINKLHLKIKDRSTGNIYYGNVWNNEYSRAFKVESSDFNSFHNAEQIVIKDPLSGDYDVQITAEAFGMSIFNQFNSQPFALVFVGSGAEIRFGGMPAPAAIPFY